MNPTHIVRMFAGWAIEDRRARDRAPKHSETWWSYNGSFHAYRTAAYVAASPLRRRKL